MNFFHVTPKSNLESIRQRGLLAAVGHRAFECGELTPAVFLFPDLPTCKDAIGGWLGECFEDEEETELVVLEVTLPQGAPVFVAAGFEVAVFSPIPPECILRVYEDAPGGLAELPLH